MDNREMVVQMRPRNRKRVVVTTDLVTGAMNGYEPIDNFNLGNAVSGLAKVASLTGLPGLSQAGTIVSGLSDAGGGQLIGKGILKNALSGIGKKKAGPAPLDIGQYENKLIRVARKDVYLVKNGQASYVPKLPLPDGRSWESVQEVSSMPQPKSVGEPVIVKSMTPVLSPIKPSVPVTPADANILAAVQASANNPATSMADTITKVVAAMPAAEKQKIQEKAKKIYDSGSNGVLTKAQKQLQDATSKILPKTKPLKEAEAILTAPQHSGIKEKPTSTLGFSTPVILGIAGVIVFILVLVIVLKR